MCFCVTFLVASTCDMFVGPTKVSSLVLTLDEDVELILIFARSVTTSSTCRSELEKRGDSPGCRAVGALPSLMTL